jgi:signal transduction histidine kinase
MQAKVAAVFPKYTALYLTTYLALAVIAVFELVVMPATGNTPWAVAGLLLIFGILFTARPLFQARSWQTHLYLALQTGVVTGLLILQPGSLMLPMLFCVLSAIAMLSLPLGTAALWVLVFILINSVHCGQVKEWEEGWLVSLPYTVGYIFCGTFAYSLRRTSAAQRHSEALLAELQTTHQQLQEYAGRVEELAISQERNRLAREMHDALGHRLTVAAVHLEGAERLIPTNPTRAAHMVTTVHAEVVEALAELRRTVATLRTPLDADLALPAALTRLMTSFEDATGVKANWLLPDELPSLPEAYRLALYRVAQEALTNVQRHAQAQQVWLELAWEASAVTLLVKDDGRGFTPETNPPGFGLRGLRERAAHLNGAFHLEANPGVGTQLCFHLPLPQAGDLPQPLAPAKSCGWKLICPFGLGPLRPDEPARESPPASQAYQI